MAKINYDGTNIVGAPYKDYVDQQIKVRQEKLGKLNKNSEDIAWENAKSGFVALASSINIENGFFTKETTTYTPPLIDLTLGGQDTTGVASGMQGSNNSPMGQEMRANLAYLAENDPFYSDYNNQGYSSDEIEAAARDAGGFTTTHDVIENEDGERRVKLLGLEGDPLNWFGNRLSTETVLYGGTAYYPKPVSTYSTPEYRFGVTQNSNAFDNSSYGYGGTDEGFKALPGITSFDIKSKNMGSLREATVTIRANSEEQFKMIDNLYCRIGYTMFIEWGNTLYFTNDNKYQSQSPITLIPTFLIGKVKPSGRETIDITENPTEFIRLIEQFREFSDGNYDAFFGRVKNFSWEYNAKEQYYEINLSLISWGDVIESLTIDAQYGSSTGETDTGEATDNTSALSTFLSIAATPKGKEAILINSDGEIKQRAFNPDLNDKVIQKTVLTNASEILEIGGIFSLNFDREVLEQAGDTITQLNYTRLANSVGKIVSSYAQFGNRNFYYVRFGDILDFIKDQLLLYSPNGSNEPIIDIDTDTDKNIMYHSGINVSADPTKVMVRGPIPYKTDQLRAMVDDTEDEWTHFIRVNSIFSFENNKLEHFASKLDPNDRTQSFPLHGKIMNIYFEFNYLMETIKGLRDENSTKIPLFDFLTKLCDTANSCLGGVNKLSVRLENDRVVKIYDQNPIYGTQFPDKESTVLNLTGVRPTLAFDEPGEILPNGSFVTDVSIKTQLTNDFSTTVSVGAQAQDKVVGEDATGLSTWNYGLVDRYYPSKIDGVQKNKNQNAPTLQERILKIRSQLKFLWLGYAEATLEQTQFVPLDSDTIEDDLKKAPPGATPGSLYTVANKMILEHFPIDKVSDFVKLQKDWLSALIKQENEIKNFEATQGGRNSYGTNQIGMIPINIQITMDGLSGIRIYDKLTVDTRFLPDYYPQTLYWIIKGVSHEINNNKWYTKLETIAVPKLREEQDLVGLINFENVPINTESFAREDVPDFVGGDSGITYSMAELTTTSTGLDNTPTPEVNAALQALNTNILQPITIAFGKIGITSGYRSPAVNTAIGGSTTSQHMKGQAVDFTKVASGRPLSEVFEFIATRLDFDQAIWEKGDDGNPRWIHVSYNNSPGAKQRGKLLRFFGNGRYVQCNAQGEV
jgi:zinc D-Ala-D-Ala carboxypeptidase